VLRVSYWWVVGCLALCFVAAGPAEATIDQTDSQRIRGVLGNVRTQEQLVMFAGKAPESCVSSRTGFELCEWWLAKADVGWKPLAEALETRYRISLICELPIDGSARGDFSCGAYPQVSNRDSWKVSTTERGRRRKASDITRERDHNLHRALEQLSSARSLAALSSLVGAIPDECSVVGNGLRLCLWRTTSRTWGHGTLATTIGASYGKKVRMDCYLPEDGRPREPDTCHVEVGA
jgi:hypothetical protein